MHRVHADQEPHTGGSSPGTCRGRACMDNPAPYLGQPFAGDRDKGRVEGGRDICHAWLPSSSSPPLISADVGVADTCLVGTWVDNHGNLGPFGDVPCEVLGTRVPNTRTSLYDFQDADGCQHDD